MIQKLTFDQIEQIADSIKTYNNVVVIETDTVMGVVSSQPEAIYEIKQRPAEKQFTKLNNDLLKRNWYILFMILTKFLI